MAATDALLIGLSNSLGWPQILIPIFGTLLAMVIAFLPGIGGASIMALMLVLTATWSTESVLLLFGALVGGATFMGSVTAILFNIPGSAPNAATLLDGFPLSQHGYTRTAISCAATASALGSIVGVLVLMLILPLINPFIEEIGPLERFLLGLWGLSTIVSVPDASRIKAMIMCLFGLVLAMFGSDPVSGQARWTFGSTTLLQGIGTIPALLGFFTIAEIISWTARAQLAESNKIRTAHDDSVRAGIVAVWKHKWLAIRASIIGTLVGIVPGIGGTVAGFVSYGHALQSTKKTEKFGQGEIRGLIAPEAANDAKDGGSLLPALAFGIPGSEAGVFLVAVFLLHGVVPGAPMLTTQLALTYTLIFALLLSNLLTSLVGLVFTPQLCKLKFFPLQTLALPILLLSFILLLQLNGQVFDVVTALVFGIFGYALKVLGWPRIPLIIAFVLGSFIERNFALSIRLIELDRIIITERPVALFIAMLTIVTLYWTGKHSARSKSDEDPQAGNLITLVLLGLASCLSLIAIVQSYSILTISVCLLLFLLTLLTLTKQLSGYPFLRKAVLSAELLKPDIADKNCVLLLVLFPFLIFLVGFHLALGIFVYRWLTLHLYPWQRPKQLGLAIGVSTLSYFLLEETWSVLAPAGILFNWI